MKNILVIGGNGFIGKYVASKLKHYGLNPIIASRYEAKSSNFEQIKFDLFDKKTWINLPRLEQVINLAWYTEHPFFWDSPHNKKYSLINTHLFKYLSKINYSHAVIAGSCAEYLCNKTSKTSELGKAKLRFLKKISENSNKNKITFAWARLFFVYGHGEPETKLLSLIRNKKTDELNIREPNSVRDFISVDMAAEQLCNLCLNNSNGIKDIGTGYGIKIDNLKNPLIIKKNMLRKFNGNPTKIEIIANTDWHLKNGIKFKKKDIISNLKNYLTSI